MLYSYISLEYIFFYIDYKTKLLGNLVLDVLENTNFMTEKIARG